jgi:hypothetical protein
MKQYNEDGTHVKPHTNCTHYSLGYEGDISFYRRTEYDVLNSVSEEWQTRVKYEYLDQDVWKDVGPGFCNRRLKPINELILRKYNEGKI